MGLLAACGAGGGGGGADAGNGADAAGGGADAAPGSGTHVLFLQFDGVDLTEGFDNAPSDVSGTVSGSATMPAWGHPELTADIIADVTSVLAPYDIDVVSARPVDGPYAMIVFGGDSELVGLPAGIPATAPVTCAVNELAVGFVFDDFINAHAAAQQAVAIEGMVHVIPQSDLDDDCMCFTSSNCTPPATAACTIGGAGTPGYDNDPCGAVATFDEAARFLAAFGAHP
ncbi:MAG TPA: hypothetical protein VL172_17935 [Kofleriaceae bacterium]|nr:hypothetical protein [Kofleriaceae bacterium]